MARVLIVDDHEEIASLFGSALREEGHEIGFAKTANEAAAMFARQPYDLVIMDFALKRSSGITASLALRGLGFDGPIIAITAGLVPVDDILYLSAKFAATLAKPLLLETLVAVVNENLPEGERE